MNIFMCAGTIATFAGVASADLWLNEFHYDNAGGDVDEGVEIAANFDMDLSLLSVYAYNGSSSQLNVYSEWHGVADFNYTTVEGGSLAWFTNLGSIQNGAPDGLAIVYDGTVIQFLSYEGSFTAGSGAAEGLTSMDIGVSESSSAGLGTSLQLSGTGSSYSDFMWSDGGEAVSTWGALSGGQSIAIPAPGALALLGLAGLARRRRK
jgi:hypothetical protein